MGINNPGYAVKEHGRAVFNVPAGAARVIAGVNAVMYGMGTWPLSAYNGAQVRVKSGGVGGTVTVDASVW